MLEAPKNVEVTYTVNTYKDMELANELEYSNSFSTYESALEFYNEETKRANGNYFVEIIMETEVEYKNKTEVHDIQLAHNETPEYKGEPNKNY